MFLTPETSWGPIFHFFLSCANLEKVPPTILVVVQTFSLWGNLCPNCHVIGQAQIWSGRWRCSILPQICRIFQWVPYNKNIIILGRNCFWEGRPIPTKNDSTLPYRWCLSKYCLWNWSNYLPHLLSVKTKIQKETHLTDLFQGLCFHQKLNRTFPTDP